ncbi:DUF975 family protein [Sporolactobacillus sp. CPB3-1]|uniref:DUF975 family protein n=1 Tax=Sporolactobacillus mangiferae TaxID=2940498 RepID=A0ABT0MA36_9BACL|nr:DUF975 family protein [Sporolactobacillus mangiferae]MCL1631728.1 DUF975 family protein [Sporolactobacillus mangiferae]
MHISELKNDARTALQGKWLKSGLFVLIYFLITSLPPFIAEIILSGGFEKWNSQYQSPLSSDLVQLIYYLICIPLQFVVYWYFLKTFRNEQASGSLLYQVYQNGQTALKLIWVNIVTIFFLILWTLLFVIPGIIKVYTYSQSFFILHDHPDYSAGKVLQESKRLMKGFKWRLFVLQLSFIGWWLLGIVPVMASIIVAGLIGFIFSDIMGYLFIAIGIVGSAWLYLWLFPYYTVSLAAFYEQIKSER